MRPHVRSSSLLDQHGDINYVTFLCSQPIQILLPEAWYQFPGTICMGRLIIRTPTLYWISNLSPKQKTTNTAACTYGRSNISSYYTNVNFNLSPNNLVMLRRYCAPTKYSSERHDNGNKIIPPYSCMPPQLPNNNSLPHYSPSLMNNRRSPQYLPWVQLLGIFYFEKYQNRFCARSAQPGQKWKSVFLFDTKMPT